MFSVGHLIGNNDGSSSLGSSIVKPRVVARLRCIADVVVLKLQIAIPSVMSADLTVVFTTDYYSIFYR